MSSHKSINLQTKSLIFENISEYLAHLKLVENKSENTVLAYKRDLKRFLDYKKNDSRLFPEYLSSQGLSPRSQARVLSAVRSYISFLENQGCKLDFRSRIESSQLKNTLPFFVSHREFEKILKQAEKDTLYASRNRLVLFFLFGLGCRVSELSSLLVSDFIDTDESIIIKGKGDKQRKLPVLEPLLSSLRDYLSNTRASLLRSYKTNALILNNRGNKPSRVDIWRWVRSWSKKAGILKYPHQFRHGCATELLNNGADLRSIQELLGHSSIETTRIYTKVSRSHLKTAVKKHHPLS